MKAILFDVDDTLYDQVVPFTLAYKKIFQNRFMVAIEELYKSSRKYSDEVFLATQKGEMSMEEMYIYRLEKAFAQFGIKITKEEALAMQEEYARNQKKLKLEEEMEQALILCKKQEVKVGIITNGPEAHQWNKIKSLGIEKYIPRDYIFVSGEIKVAKPDIAIFEYAEKKMGFRKEEGYYIGDSYDNDIVGAKNAGWKSIWINRRKHKTIKNEIKPDYYVESGADLLELLVSKIL